LNACIPAFTEVFAPVVAPTAPASTEGVAPVIRATAPTGKARNRSRLPWDRSLEVAFVIRFMMFLSRQNVGR
jgi:hypothetical protein